MKAKIDKWALARWLSWLECCPIHQKVAGSIPGQGTRLGCGFNTQLAHIWEAINQCSSLTSTFLSPSLSKVNNKHILK